MTIPTTLMLVAGTAGVTWVLFRCRSRGKTQSADWKPQHCGEVEAQSDEMSILDIEEIDDEREPLREASDEAISQVVSLFTTQTAAPSEPGIEEQSLPSEPKGTEVSQAADGLSEVPAIAAPAEFENAEQSLPAEAMEAEVSQAPAGPSEEPAIPVPAPFASAEQSIPTATIEAGASRVPDGPSKEPAIAVPAEQYGLLLTPADDFFQQNETAIQFERDETAQATEAVEREPLAADPEILKPPSDAACAVESAPQAPTVNGKDGELGASLDTMAPSPAVDGFGSDDEGGSEVGENSEPPLAESEPRLKARSFTEPKPSPVTKSLSNNPRKPDTKPRAEFSAPIRLQLVFGRGWTVKTLALVPHRREGMPGSIDVIAAHGRLRLSEWSADSYEPIPVLDVPNALSEGVVFEGRSGGQRWRWELSRRQIYVLAAAEEFGLHGFVTRRKDQRLWLNTPHVVLAEENLREQVSVALDDAGCTTPDVSDSGTPGVPSGWVLFRDVKPTRAVPMRDERDILNVLCPAHEIEPQFDGGIRLERNVWLAGFPPRIRFDGEMGSGFEVLIDDQPTQLASDGAFESPGWDGEGDHRLWFGGRAETYSLRVMKEEWERWDAHDFGTGAAICGASTHQTDGARWRQVRIPSMNPLLVGARPGEIFCYQCRHGVRSGEILALVPFAPVWALPLDPVHADKSSVRLVVLNRLEPIAPAKHGDQITGRALMQWLKAIKDTSRKQLAFAANDDAAKVLWRRYVSVAKQLWRKMR